MATLTAQGQVVAGEPKAQAKKQESTKRRRGGRTDDSGARYFLVKTSGAEKIELGEEASSESEAMVSAFRTGGTFAVVTEWKTNADLSSSLPVIKKEAVRRERK